MSGGTAPNGNTSNLPLFGTPEQQMADPFSLFPGTPPSPASSMGNLGASTMVPYAPHGAFNGNIQPQGAGQYNNMAAQSAGRLFNPSLNTKNTPITNHPLAAPTAPNAPGSGAKGIGQGFQSGMQDINKLTSLNGNLPGLGGGNGQTAGRILLGGL